MDLVVDDAMHPPADQSSRPGKENGNQFFRTGHWALDRFWEQSWAEWVKGTRSLFLSGSYYGEQANKESIRSEVILHFTLLWADIHGLTS